MSDSEVAIDSRLVRLTKALPVAIVAGLLTIPLRWGVSALGSLWTGPPVGVASIWPAFAAFIGLSLGRAWVNPRKQSQQPASVFRWSTVAAGTSGLLLLVGIAFVLLSHPGEAARSEGAGWAILGLASLPIYVGLRLRE